jgi:hypothetical protein
LVERAKTHSVEKKIAAATVNKLLGGVQAIAVWGFHNGLTPDDVPWSDPFARMRLDEEEPQREPWEVAELQLSLALLFIRLAYVPAGGVEKQPTGFPASACSRKRGKASLHPG